MQVDINPDQAQTRQADSRGRVNLGMEYADREVELVILTKAKVGENE